MSVAYNCLIPLFANLAPGFLLGVRSDTPEVDLLDNLRQDTINYMQYRTHVVELGDERKFRPLRVYVKGTGTVTNGSLVFTFDGDLVETYTATGAYNDPVAGVLMHQQCLGTKTVRQCDLTITIGGTNLEIFEILWDIVETE